MTDKSNKDTIKQILADGGLMIVESPTKAREISSFLGQGWRILPTKGFMFELKDPKKLSKKEQEHYRDYSIRVDDGSFDRLLDHDSQNRSNWRDIVQAVDSGRWKHFYVSTDPDEAGELIGREVVDALGSKLRNMDVRRASWHEITKKAVLQGLADYGPIDRRKADAAEARQVYDRLFGFSVSPYLWRTVGSGTSGGRTQSPALRLIVKREEDRLGFVKTGYNTITAIFNKGTDKELEATLTEWDGSRIATGSDFNAEGKLDRKNRLHLDDGNTKAILKELGTMSFLVTDIKESPYTRRPAPPYTTSSYQQNVGGRLGLSSKRAMTIAQQLFENAIQTYSRTDSPAMADEAIKAARSIIRKDYGGDMPAQPIRYKSKSKSAQEGHECIRPIVDDTGSFPSPSAIRSRTRSKQFDSKAGDVYDLVYRRTVASQMSPATGTTRRITVKSKDGKAVFTASSTRIEHRGFLEAYDDED